MSVNAIREYHGKHMLQHLLAEMGSAVEDYRGVLVSQETLDELSGTGCPPPDADLPHGWQELAEANPWLVSGEKLVVESDRLIKRCGKAGLTLANATYREVAQWTVDNMSRPPSATRGAMMAAASGSFTARSSGVSRLGGAGGTYAFPAP